MTPSSWWLSREWKWKVPLQTWPRLSKFDKASRLDQQLRRSARQLVGGLGDSRHRPFDGYPPVWVWFWGGPGSLFRRVVFFCIVLLVFLLLFIQVNMKPYKP